MAENTGIPKQRTLVIMKPDGVKRALVGQILERFERAGLKLVGMKMMWVDTERVGKHYTDNAEYLISVGEKALENYQKCGLDPQEKLGTMDPLEVGKLVRKWNLDYMTNGPVVAMVLEAPHAVELVRKMVGHTFPQNAQPGTIRGDFSGDSTFISNQLQRSVKNLLHASGTEEEAKFEMELWFHESEMFDYERADEKLIWE